MDGKGVKALCSWVNSTIRPIQKAGSLSLPNSERNKETHSLLQRDWMAVFLLMLKRSGTESLPDFGNFHLSIRTEDSLFDSSLPEQQKSKWTSREEF